MKKILCLFAAVSNLILFAAGPLPVLCLVSEDTANQGLTEIDLRAAAAYRANGFDLHFGFYQQTTREELMRYPIVVGMIPQLHAGTEAVSPRLAEDFDYFMKSGGGLVMIPGPSYYGIDDFVRLVNPFLNRYGIGVSNDIPKDSIPANTITQVRALAYRYLKTSALKPDHPVTAGIPYIYLPLDFSYAYVRTYTMTQPSPEWEILITGEESCGSFLRKSMVSGNPEPGLWKTKPPFLAVRPVGKGFLALFTTASRYFIYDACHWAFGDGFVLNEGHGLKLMAQLFSYVSQNRAQMPPAPTAPVKKPVPVPESGNLPVVQSRREWYNQVFQTFLPKGFGVLSYIDAGGIADALYRKSRGCGVLPDPDGSWPVRRTWLDIFHPTAASGRATDRKSFRYRFDHLDPECAHQLGLLVWSTQKEGARDLEIRWIDSEGREKLLKTVPLPRYDLAQGPRFEVVPLPEEAAQSGSLTLDFRRGKGGTGDFTLLAELWLFEEGAPQMSAEELSANFNTPAFGVSLQPEEKVWHRGLVGARSPENAVQESVADLANAARESGFDFLAFTDEFTAISPERFSRLVAACNQVSTAGVQAIPGLQLSAAETGPARPDRPQRNRTINAWFAGPIRKLPDAKELANPHELFWKFFGGEYAGGVRTVGNLCTPDRNELSPYFQRFWRGFDLATLDENGTESGNAELLYRELTADGYGPQPRVRGIYRSPDEIRRAANGWHLTIPTPPKEAPWPFLYSSCVSSGPKFQHVSFASDLTRDGEPGNGDIFREELWTVATLKLTHTAPITDAILYSGSRIIRHFRPAKTEVSISEPVRIDRQTSLFWIVKASDGTMAVTGSYSFTDERMRGSMCADNQNSICSVGRTPSGFVRDERELYLQHSYWHTGEAQGQLGVMRDARELVPRVIETGIVQLCKYVQPMPLLKLADGREENHLNSKMSIAAASGEGNRIHYEFDQPGSLLRSSVNLTAFRPDPAGDTTVLVEIEIRANRAIAAQEIDSLRLLSIGVMPSFPANWHFRAETAPGKFQTGKLSGSGREFSLPWAPRGIAALYPNNLAEPVVVSLNAEPLELLFDEVKLWNCRERLSVRLPRKTWKKDEVARFAFLIQLTQQPVDSGKALAVKKTGLLERAKAVEEVRSGKLANTTYTLDFEAENHAGAWRHTGWSLRDPLPIRIWNLNPNWSALASWDGKTLHPLPVDETGTGWFSLPPSPAGNAVFGNPVIADDPGLRIEYAGVSKRGVSFRVHNPGAEAKTFQIRSNPAFESVLPPFSFRLTLNPGAGMWVNAKHDKLQLDSIQ